VPRGKRGALLVYNVKSKIVPKINFGGLPQESYLVCCQDFLGNQDMFREGGKFFYLILRAGVRTHCSGLPPQKGASSSKGPNNFVPRALC